MTCATRFLGRHLTALGGACVFLAALSMYIATLAPAPVPGDPSEYTFIPWILGIAHPPGYAFYTLLAALWQRLAPIGDVVYRTHLLAATAGALSATLLYAIVLTILNKSSNPPTNPLAALFAGLSFAFATDVWQHSIHANAHIITLLLATTSVFLLVRWWVTQTDRWLFAFSLIAGFSPAQHPLLLFGFPAYAMFILVVRPRILRQPRVLLAMIACAALGLSVFLYYPLRSPTTPFGVSDIRSWDSFVHFVTAEGLRVNLFAFGLADQPTRFSVFVNLLQLQYSPLVILLAVFGWITLLRPNRTAYPALILFTVFVLLLVVFVMNTIQDVMAYLMLPFMSLAVLAGLGLGKALSVALSGVYQPHPARVVTILAAAALMGLTAATALPRALRVSLREYTAGQDWIRRVYDRFEGKGEGAFLLAPWEALTPLWVEQYIHNHPLDPRDVQLVYVAASSPNPWLDSVWAYFDTGPVYLADYRRQVVEGGLFRLRPDGVTPPLWRVVAPGDTSLPPLQSTLNATSADPIELLAYSLDRSSLHAGETAYLTLAMRAPATPAHVVMPFARVGERWMYRWTTDSHALSTTWQPGEVIVERYEIILPFSMPPGEYPLAIGVTDLSAGRDLQFAVERLGPQVDVSVGALLRVDPPRLIPDLSGQSILADFGAQAALVSATAATDGRRMTTASGAWTQPLVAQPGQSIQVWLDWIALQQPLDNYKVFVHLITPGEQLAALPADFYTPLGGAFPTHLWIPKWIEGQRVSDPYTLNLPPDIPPGEYRIQVGLYGLASNRRLHIVGPDGNLAGDRVILGRVVVP